MGDAWTKFGITAEEASERIMKFSKRVSEISLTLF